LFHLDADILSSSSADEFPDENLLSLKHVRALYNILRPDKPAVFSVLSKEYAVDVHEMGDRLIIDFLEEPTNGPQHLLEFADAVCRKASANAKSFMAVAITQLISLLGCRLHDSRHVQGQGIMTRAEFRRGALRFFWGCNGHLQSAHKVVDVSQTRDLVYYLGVLLSDLCQWHDEAAIELARGLLHKERTSSAAEPTDSVPDRGLIAFQEHPRDRHILVSDTWKLKLLIKYVVKGRMELRVMSIATMDAALVALWKRYNESTAGARHPVMQYFADFLLDEKVVDYIISVDSHPQIISRSGNIVGFLVVTNRYSVAQTDAIWRTISNSQDPRVVSATFTMLRIIMNLMDASDLLYLCSKLFGLAIGSYSLETLRFVYEIYDKLEQKRFYDWKSTDVSARPWNVSIRIIQDTPPSIESTKLSLDLHHVACQQLEHMAGAVGPQEREQIYTDCARLIADRSPKATGSIRALHIFCSKGTYSEASFFRQHPDISRQILEELCFFVKSQNQQGYYPLYPEALNYRLEMLRFLVLRALDSIPADLYSDIWDHIIGKYALNNQIRDQAWLKLAEIVKLQPDNGFSKQLISAYVPQLEPEFFTQGMFDFVASYNFPITRQKVSTGEGELLQIRGADLLWQLVMTAPQGTIENRAAELLASRYVEIDRSQKVTVQELENAHVALVEKCTAELLSAYRSLRGVSAGGPSEREHVDAGEYQEPMEITTSDSARQQIELRFCRTALFEKLLLRTIRTKPEFCRARPSESDSDVQLSEPTPNHGDIIQIRYNGENTANKQALSIGTENTLQDLETRICDATGFTKVNLFYSGQKLNVSENAEAMLSEFKLAPNAFLLVQKAAGSQTRQPLSDDRTGCSVFETAVLNHFEDLFSCMDSDDRISAVVSDWCRIATKCSD
jgi:ubiquitin carboxyl-terminal hydrolase 34